MVGTLVANEAVRGAGGLGRSRSSGLEDLCGLTVGTTRGSREMVFVDDQNPKCTAAGKKPINALAFNDGNGAAEALMSRRADLFWLGSTAVELLCRSVQGPHQGRRAATPTRSYLGVGLPKGSPMAKPLQAAIQYLVDNGTYTKIVTKWGLLDGAIKQVPINPTGTPR